MPSSAKTSEADRLLRMEQQLAEKLFEAGSADREAVTGQMVLSIQELGLGMRDVRTDPRMEPLERLGLSPLRAQKMLDLCLMERFVPWEFINMDQLRVWGMCVGDDRRLHGLSQSILPCGFMDSRDHLAAKEHFQEVLEALWQGQERGGKGRA